MDAERVAAPALGEPPPLELANTVFVAHGEPCDGLDSVSALTDLLRRVRTDLAMPLTDADLRRARRPQLSAARDLRECVRALASSVVRDERPDGEMIARLNRHALAAPRYHQLRWDGQRLHSEPHSGVDPVTTAIAAIAELAVAMLAEPAGTLGQCAAPGCVLFFRRGHPRREWCSAGCGDRVRAARYYRRRTGRE